MTEIKMPIRALIVDLSTSFGGASMRAMDLVKGMPGGQAALAGLEGSPLIRRAEDLGLEVYSVGRSKCDPLIFKRLARLAQTKGFNIFDTQNPQSKLWGTLAACITKAGLVSTLNSWYLAEHQGLWRGRIYQRLEFLTTPWTDAFITVSSDIEKNIKNSCANNINTAMIPNAVAIDTGMIKDLPPDWLKSKFNLPKDSIICCAVGRLVAAKGFHHLINSLNLLDPRFVCLIIGEGHLRDSLAANISQLGLQDRIRLTGFCEPEEVLNIVFSSDIFVMPSITEGTPIAILEAAALGKPIVATKTGGIPEILTNIKHAFLVDPGNEKQLADAVFWIYNNWNQAKKMGNLAREHIEKHYSLDTQVKETLAVYQNVLLTL
jgi:glycosyltransferase involved in cell wall biosynthesis